jgi:hypothetical protein
MDERCAAGDSTQTGVAPALVCSQARRTWRCQPGAPAWAALEELALTECHDAQGWASLAGVSDIATGVGTTDTGAARALVAMARAGLVALGPVTDALGHRRLGYRLQLREGITVDDGPSMDGAVRGMTARCPNDRDAGCPGSDDHPHEDHDGYPCPTGRAAMAIDPSDVARSTKQR